MHRLERVLEAAELELASRDPPRGSGTPRREARGDLWLTRQRRAAGAHRGQPVDLERRARLGDQFHEPLAGQPDHPLALGAVLEQEHRRDRIGVKALREREPSVDLGNPRERQPLCLAGRLLAGRLRHQPRAGGVEGGQQLIADRAVVLDDR